MLKQNWFMASNMEMFYEYFESQYFFDTASKAIYLVTEGQHGIVIEELQEDADVYDEYYAMYEAWRSENGDTVGARINTEKVSHYIESEDILEFDSDDECLDYFNTYDYQHFQSVEEMKAYQGKYGFNVGLKRYHIERDEALDVWEPIREEILFHAACLERYLALAVKAEQKQRALEIINKAYDTWCESPESVGDVCCEEYICKCLTSNGIEYVQYNIIGGDG